MMRFTSAVLMLATLILEASSTTIFHHQYGHLHTLSSRALTPKRGLSDAEQSKLESVGVRVKEINSTRVWVGTDGPFTNTFINTSGQDLILLIWGEQGSWVNVQAPLVMQALAPGGSIVVSFLDGTSGAWSTLFDETTLVNGQVFNTWGEYTFAGIDSTVDVSRLVNMHGNDMTIITPACTSNMDTCVFVCRGAGLVSCQYDYELHNCAASEGGGTGQDSSGAPSGGCHGMGDKAALFTYLEAKR